MEESGGQRDQGTERETEAERERMGERQRQRVTPNLTLINRHNRLHTGDTGRTQQGQSKTDWAHKERE